MLTKDDLYSGRCSKNEYYAGFLTSQIVDIVRKSTVYKHIISARDKINFFDVNSRQWDFVSGSIFAIIGSKPFKERGDFVSQNALIAIAKAAARQIIEERRSKIT
jgi:hypothetical protein